MNNQAMELVRWKVSSNQAQGVERSFNNNLDLVIPTGFEPVSAP